MAVNAREQRRVTECAHDAGCKPPQAFTELRSATGKKNSSVCFRRAEGSTKHAGSTPGGRKGTGEAKKTATQLPKRLANSQHTRLLTFCFSHYGFVGGRGSDAKGLHAGWRTLNLQCKGKQQALHHKSGSAHTQNSASWVKGKGITNQVLSRNSRPVARLYAAEQIESRLPWSIVGCYRGCSGKCPKA